VRAQQLQRIEETREPPVRKVEGDQTNTLRGDRHHSTVGKHITTQPDTAPKRQQTISSFHPATESGGQERQEHHGKQPAERDLQALKHRAQIANKFPSNSSHATKQHSNHVVRDSGSQKPHDAGLSDKHPSHHAAARSSTSQSSHKAKVPRGPTKLAPTGANGAGSELGKRLVASVHAQQQQSLHQHPASQRVQTQARAQIPPPSSSSSLKQEQRDKKAHLERLIKGEEDDLWSDRNVAIYEAKVPAPLVARQTHASSSLAFPAPKPVAPRQQQSPPPQPVVPHPKHPSSALRKQPNGSILKQLQTEGRREKERRARAQHDSAATDDEDLPGERGRHDKLFGGEVSHMSWKPSAATAAAPSSYRSTHHVDDTPTQSTAGSHDAKQPLTHDAPSVSNNFSGIHPGSLPSKLNLEYKHDNEDGSDPTDQQPPPTGPFSLNSAAGVRAIEKTIPPPPPRPMVLPYETTNSSSRTTTQRFMGSGSNGRRAKTAGLEHQDSPAPFSKASAASKSQPLHITANDLHLYKWRAEKLTWAETRERWSRLHGEDVKANSSEYLLRARFRAVQKAIEDERVKQALCSAVLDGVAGAEEELNRVVAELQQEQAEPELEMGVFRKIASGKGGGNVKQESGRQQQRQVSTAHQQQQYAGNLPLSNPPLAVAGTRPASPLRPTQGGKFYDATTFQAYIEHMGETVAEAFEDSDSDSDAYVDLNNPRQASPFRTEDYVQWQYYMQRRDFTTDDLAALPENQQDPTASLSEIEIEDQDEDSHEYNPQTRWKTYTHPFTTLATANAEAALFLWTTPLGSPQTYSPTLNFSLSTTHDPFGMCTFSLKSPLGLAQVRVARRLLTYQDHIIPERSEKEGWVPRVLWCVVAKVHDPKKGDEVQDEQSSISNNKIFSSLALANARAVDEWVKLTVKIRSANLNQIQIERDHAKIGLLRKLERVGGYGGVEGDGDGDEDGSGERAKYFKEVLVEEPVDGEAGSGRRVEVFVQEVMLEGPRN
jgi:hypothetical protein